jgi:hypothetical protein
MIVEELQSFNDPCVQTAMRMLCDFAYDVNAIFEPRKFGARSGGENRDFAVFALVTGFHNALFLRRKERAPAFAEALHYLLLFLLITA